MILDTTVLVDAERRGGTAFEESISDADDVAIAAITVAELAVGVEMADSTRRHQARRAFVTAVLEALSVESYGLEVARAHGALLAHTRRAGRPRGAHDLIVAATARASGREVLSADESAFAELPEVVVRRS